MPLPSSPPHPPSRALLSLEVCKVQQYPFTESQQVVGYDWELYLAEIAVDICKEQSPKSLYFVRCVGGQHA